MMARAVRIIYEYLLSSMLTYYLVDAAPPPTQLPALRFEAGKPRIIGIAEVVQEDGETRNPLVQGMGMVRYPA